MKLYLNYTYMSIQVSEVLVEFFKENEKLNNHDLYITYLHKFCKSDFEKALINRVHSEAFGDSTIIRYRNHLIKEGIFAPYSQFRDTKQKEYSEFFSPINRVLSGFRNWFK